MRLAAAVLACLLSFCGSALAHDHRKLRILIRGGALPRSHLPHTTEYTPALQHLRDQQAHPFMRQPQLARMAKSVPDGLDHPATGIKVYAAIQPLKAGTDM